MTDGKELAEFLRARRERITPSDVGLPTNGRRRTPGLRREEVATLAGVSIDYLIRLEQGRDTHPSPAVISALADALQLSEEERNHLAKLAAMTSAPELCPDAGVLANEVRPRILQLLDTIDPTPAFVLGPLNDVLAWNAPWSYLVEAAGMFDVLLPNLPRYVFTNPKARSFFVDWESAADEQVGQLRSARPQWGGEDHFIELVAELAPLQEFSARWDAHAVTEKRPGAKRFAHPDVGEIRIDHEVLVLPDDAQRLVTWHAADAATTAALSSFVVRPSSPAQLRVVGPA